MQDKRRATQELQGKSASPENAQSMAKRSASTENVQSMAKRSFSPIHFEEDNKEIFGAKRTKTASPIVFDIGVSTEKSEEKEDLKRTGSPIAFEQIDQNPGKLQLSYMYIYGLRQAMEKIKFNTTTKVTSHKE